MFLLIIESHPETLPDFWNISRKDGREANPLGQRRKGVMVCASKCQEEGSTICVHLGMILLIKAIEQFPYFPLRHLKHCCNFSYQAIIFRFSIQTS